jgi:adenine phosphoribosyltransferase
LEELVIESYIRDVPDFPKQGIVFKDITPLLQNPAGLAASIEALARVVDPADYDLVCGIESRGFIFGSALAHHLDKGFIPIRKPGKLPYRTVRMDYALEYGADALEAHEDALRPGERVLLIDDLLATGGSAAATASLVQQLGARVVAAAFLIELSFLDGRGRLGEIPVHSVVQYDAE